LPLLSVFAELDLAPLELELGGGGGSSLEETGVVSSKLELLFTIVLELLFAIIMPELLLATIMIMLELDLGWSWILSLLELDSSLSPQKTSNKLSLPSLHPKTASTKATANKNKRISII